MCCSGPVPLPPSFQACNLSLRHHSTRHPVSSGTHPAVEKTFLDSAALQLGEDFEKKRFKVPDFIRVQHGDVNTSTIVELSPCQELGGSGKEKTYGFRDAAATDPRPDRRDTVHR
jgi:hypothetical protein